MQDDDHEDQDEYEYETAACSVGSASGSLSRLLTRLDVARTPHEGCSLACAAAEASVNEALGRRIPAPPLMLHYLDSGTFSDVLLTWGTTEPRQEKRVHAIVLASSSPFFRVALEGSFREGRERAIHLTLTDDDEEGHVPCFLRLLYGASVCGMDVSQKLAILLLANRFSVLPLVQSLALSMEHLGPTEARWCLENLPEELMAAETSVKRLHTLAADSLANSLGPVDTWWENGIVWTGSRVPTSVEVLPLRREIRALELVHLRAVLQSPALVVRNEADTFVAIQSWLDHAMIDQGWDLDRARDVFRQAFLPLLSFARMTRAFLGRVVLVSRYLDQASTLALAILATCGRRHYGPPARRLAPGTPMLLTTFPLDPLTTGTEVWRGLGYIMGYRLLVGLQREALRDSKVVLQLRVDAVDTEAQILSLIDARVQCLRFMVQGTVGPFEVPSSYFVVGPGLAALIALGPWSIVQGRGQVPVDLRVHVHDTEYLTDGGV